MVFSTPATPLVGNKVAQIRQFHLVTEPVAFSRWSRTANVSQVDLGISALDRWIYYPRLIAPPVGLAEVFAHLNSVS